MQIVLNVDVTAPLSAADLTDLLSTATNSIGNVHLNDYNNVSITSTPKYKVVTVGDQAFSVTSVDVID